MSTLLDDRGSIGTSRKYKHSASRSRGGGHLLVINLFIVSILRVREGVVVFYVVIPTKFTTESSFLKGFRLIKSTIEASCQEEIDVPLSA